MTSILDKINRNGLEFNIKSQKEIDEWLEEIEDRMSDNDFDYLATIVFLLANMDDFIFSSDEVSDKFLHYQADHHYGGDLH